MRRAFLVVLALLLAGAGLLYYLFGQDIARARAPLVGRSQVVDTTFGMSNTRNAVKAKQCSAFMAAAAASIRAST